MEGLLQLEPLTSSEYSFAYDEQENLNDLFDSLPFWKKRKIFYIYVDLLYYSPDDAILQTLKLKNHKKKIYVFPIYAKTKKNTHRYFQKSALYVVPMYTHHPISQKFK